MIIYNYTSGNCAVSIPNTLAEGFNCTFINLHATNTVLFSGSGGMVVNSKLGLRLDSNYASASLFVRATNASVLVGALTT
jgi:hypothetical protein